MSGLSNWLRRSRLVILKEVAMESKDSMATSKVYFAISILNSNLKVRLYEVPTTPILDSLICADNDTYAEGVVY